MIMMIIVIQALLDELGVAEGPGEPSASEPWRDLLEAKSNRNNSNTVIINIMIRVLITITIII